MNMCLPLHLFRNSLGISEPMQVCLALHQIPNSLGILDLVSEKIMVGTFGWGGGVDGIRRRRRRHRRHGQVIAAML